MSDQEKPAQTPDEAAPAAKVVKVHKCPICGKLTDNAKYRPFCSKRCADIDLGRWFAEDYTVPAVELDEQEIEELENAFENKTE